MNLFRTTAALMLVAALAGCATVPNLVKSSYVYGADATYGATAQQAAKIYGSLPYCAKGTTTSLTDYCQDPRIEVQVAKANGDVATARKPLEAFVQNPANYPSLSYSQLLGALQTAVTTLEKIEAQNGVHA